MPIDADFVDKWSTCYDEANKGTKFRLAGTRLDTELARRFPSTHAKFKTLETWWDFENYLFTTISEELVPPILVAVTTTTTSSKGSLRPRWIDG